MVAVAEPFERRVQLFGHLPPRDPSAPRATALPAFDGVASHFSREVALDGQTLVVWEPESASGLVFDLRPEIPIHVTTFGGPGTRAGSFGQVSAACVDESGNRIHVADPVRRVHASLALLRGGQAPAFDPFMPRLVREASFAPADAMIRASGSSADSASVLHWRELFIAKLSFCCSMRPPVPSTIVRSLR